MRSACHPEQVGFGERSHAVHCARCRAGYTNLVVRKLDGSIELDPHATGACVLSLTEPEARELHTVIGEMLG